MFDVANDVMNHWFGIVTPFLLFFLHLTMVLFPYYLTVNKNIVIIEVGHFSPQKRTLLTRHIWFGLALQPSSHVFCI